MTAAQQVRRPLVGIACSLVAGFYVQHLFGGSPLLFLGLGAGVLSWVCWRLERRGVLAGIYIACTLLAAATSAIEKTNFPARSVLPLAEVMFQEQEVVGRIDDSPVISDEDGTQSFRFRAEAVRFGAEWFCSDTILRVYTKDSAKKAAYGERWRIKGRYRGYEKVRIGLEGSLRANAAVRLREATFSFRAACYKARHRASLILRAGIEAFPEQIQLLHALLLGYRKALSPSLYQTFATTGTLHIFAISGLHVGVVAAILIAALKMMGIPRPRWGLLLIPVLFFYVVSTGMKASALRAFTMAAVYFAAPLLDRRPDPASSIALAAIILLAINPLQITDPGFLLSFTVVGGIVIVHGYANRQLSGFSRPAWAIPLAQLSGPRPLRALVRAIGLLALTSVAAWLFSAPLTARFFNTLSPVALAGNLVIIPLTFMIVFTGCLALLVAPVSFFATMVFNHANRLFVGLLISMIRTIGTLPGAYRFVRSPSAAVLALWYAGLILFFTGTTRMRKLAVFLTLGSVLLWAVGAFRPFSGIEIHKIGATTTAIRSAPTRWLLVTDGNTYGTGRTVRCLQREGINRLHALVVSDRRADAKAVERLCSTFSPKEIWMAPDLQNGLVAEKLNAGGLPVAFSSHPEWSVGAGVLSVSLRAY